MPRATSATHSPLVRGPRSGSSPGRPDCWVLATAPHRRRSGWSPSSGRPARAGARGPDRPRARGRALSLQPAATRATAARQSTSPTPAHGARARAARWRPSHGDGGVERGDTAATVRKPVWVASRNEPGRHRGQHPADRAGPPAGPRHPGRAHRGATRRRRRRRRAGSARGAGSRPPRGSGRGRRRGRRTPSPAAAPSSDAGPAGGAGVPAAGLAGDQPDARQRGGDADPDQRAGAFPDGQADQHRQGGGPDARDRGDDAHPARRQAAVEERRTDAVAHAGPDGPAEVGRGRGAADERGQDRGRRRRPRAGRPRRRPRGWSAWTGLRRRSRPGRRPPRRAATGRRRPCQGALTWPGRRRPR